VYLKADWKRAWSSAQRQNRYAREKNENSWSPWSQSGVYQSPFVGFGKNVRHQT